MLLNATRSVTFLAFEPFNVDGYDLPAGSYEGIESRLAVSSWPECVSFSLEYEIILKGSALVDMYGPEICDARFDVTRHVINDVLIVTEPSGGK